MFKWIVKTWKIWKLNRKWYEVLYYEDDDRDQLNLVKVSFGRRLYKMHQNSQSKLLVRKNENEWYTIEQPLWVGFYLKRASKEVEQKYQEYLNELAELNLL